MPYLHLWPVRITHLAEQVNALVSGMYFHFSVIMWQLSGQYSLVPVINLSALGVFDASLIRDLGLPTIRTKPGRPGSSDLFSTVVSLGRTHKFQLGETFPNHILPSHLLLPLTFKYLAKNVVLAGVLQSHLLLQKYSVKLRK